MVWEVRGFIEEVTCELDLEVHGSSPKEEGSKEECSGHSTRVKLRGVKGERQSSLSDA